MIRALPSRYIGRGKNHYAANGGGWGNSQGGAIESDAPLANADNGTYTLSVIANGGATPVLLELLAGGVPVTPTSSVDPVLSGMWQEFSRTYDPAALAGSIGQPLTVRLGIGPVAAGTQAHIDNVRLSVRPYLLFLCAAKLSNLVFRASFWWSSVRRGCHRLFDVGANPSPFPPRRGIRV